MSANSNTGSPSKVFLDRNVRARGVIIEPVVHHKPMQWGPIKLTTDLYGWRRKSWRDGDAQWAAGEVECLPTVARLASDGIIALFESREVRAESLQASPGGRGTKGDIFAGSPITGVPDAVDRSYFASKTLDQLARRDDVIGFCRLLRQTTPQLLEGSIEFWASLPPAMQANLRDLGRFHELIDALPHKRHWPDALHLWTAETNAANFFLTMDKKFINALTKTARLSLPTRPLLPSELLAELGVTEREPLPFSGSGFLDDFLIMR